MKRAPAHAGGLRASERLAFVVVFSLMAAFVVGLTVLAAKSGADPLIRDTTPAGFRTIPPRSVHDQVGAGGKRRPAADSAHPGGIGRSYALRLLAGGAGGKPWGVAAAANPAAKMILTVAP